MGKEEDVFSKTKQKISFSDYVRSKNLPFHDDLYHVVFFYFSTARQVVFALHNKIW